jgi:hypothetical protein
MAALDRTAIKHTAVRQTILRDMIFPLLRSAFEIGVPDAAAT